MWPVFFALVPFLLLRLLLGSPDKPHGRSISSGRQPGEAPEGTETRRTAARTRLEQKQQWPRKRGTATIITITQTTTKTENHVETKTVTSTLSETVTKTKTNTRTETTVAEAEEQAADPMTGKPAEGESTTEKKPSTASDQDSAETGVSDSAMREEVEATDCDWTELYRELSMPPLPNPLNVIDDLPSLESWLADESKSEQIHAELQKQPRNSRDEAKALETGLTYLVDRPLKEACASLRAVHSLLKKNDTLPFGRDEKPITEEMLASLDKITQFVTKRTQAVFAASARRDFRGDPALQGAIDHLTLKLKTAESTTSIFGDFCLHKKNCKTPERIRELMRDVEAKRALVGAKLEELSRDLADVHESSKNYRVRQIVWMILGYTLLVYAANVIAGKMSIYGLASIAYVATAFYWMVERPSWYIVAFWLLLAFLMAVFWDRDELRRAWRRFRYGRPVRPAQNDPRRLLEN